MIKVHNKFNSSVMASMSVKKRMYHDGVFIDLIENYQKMII